MYGTKGGKKPSKPIETHADRGKGKTGLEAEAKAGRALADDELRELCKKEQSTGAARSKTPKEA